MKPESPATRLFVESDLASGARFLLSLAQAHQLRHVQRLEDGATVALFNGRDGEYAARLTFSKREAEVEILAPRRAQNTGADLWLLFAPIKHNRIDFLVEKASELGVAELYPVVTRRTQVTRVNCERLRENAREAAEQCERLTVPKVHEPQALETVLKDWDKSRPLFACMESGDAVPLAEAAAVKFAKAAILIGPEGGFAPEEDAYLRQHAAIVPVGLGPRLLRAETAAVAALSIWQATAGEWVKTNNRPHADLF